MTAKALPAYHYDASVACDWCSEIDEAITGTFWDGEERTFCLYCTETVLDAAVAASFRTTRLPWSQWLFQGQAYAYRAEPILGAARAEHYIKDGRHHASICWACSKTFVTLSRRAPSGWPSAEMCPACATFMAPGLNLLQQLWQDAYYAEDEDAGDEDILDEVFGIE